MYALKIVIIGSKLIHHKERQKMSLLSVSNQCIKLLINVKNSILFIRINMESVRFEFRIHIKFDFLHTSSFIKLKNLLPVSKNLIH